MPPNASPAQTWTGIACGMGAGALWGLVFLAPELARAFTPLDMTIGRYLAFGLLSAALLAPNARDLARRVTVTEVKALLWLALTGNTLYYVLLSNAVQLGGIAMTSLVIGFVPVAVTIIGSRDAHAVPFARLLPSLALCSAGVVCIGWQALARPSHAGGSGLIGLVCAVGALGCWTLYAVNNSRHLVRLRQFSAHEWSLMNGLATGVQAIALIPLALILPGHNSHAAGDWAMLAGVSLAVATLASIAGNGLWNRMCRLLPLTMVGQMILFETLFALLYGFIWEQRWPTGLETLAFALLVASVFGCLAAHRPRAVAA
ncbi:EamA family transporter [Novosphingobium sp. FSY-8]|uniref:EamA family transporter n=1 Tax=Novosphingobium ovatum TaxID=1908523 RepID=A0ABW9XGU9_9SPHN|nr:DMT family transporter [Novosphingobium ovatum]NBC37775.1 EamA family transporter [Novosphingobium ovatum]